MGTYGKFVAKRARAGRLRLPDASHRREGASDSTLVSSVGCGRHGARDVGVLESRRSGRPSAGRVPDCPSTCDLTGQLRLGWAADDAAAMVSDSLNVRGAAC